MQYLTIKKLSLIKDKETYIFDETSITIKSDMDKVFIKEKTGKTTELYAGNNIALYTQSIPILSGKCTNQYGMLLKDENTMWYISLKIRRQRVVY